MKKIQECIPILEIRLADTLRTRRSRSDAKGAKLLILFPERSSLSRFIHSPMHPRSNIPVKPRKIGSVNSCDIHMTFIQMYETNVCCQIKGISVSLFLNKGDLTQAF